MLKKGLIGFAAIVVLSAVAVWAFWPAPWTVNAPITNSLFGWGVDTPEQSAVRAKLDLPDGASVALYARDLGQARILKFTPHGDLLVSVPREGRIVILRRDGDGDGRADAAETLIDGLDRPHGIELVDGTLFIGETSAIGRVDYDSARGAIVGDYRHIVSGLPGGGNHWTRTVRQGPDGALYVNIGSSCNVCLEEDERRATILRIALDGSTEEIFATGLRNTLGFDWHPTTGVLWGGDNGRDLLGDDVPPEELNRIVEGGFYGWPYFYGDNVIDRDFDATPPPEADPVAPAMTLKAHMAPVSFRFVSTEKAPAALQGNALMGLHGSWNRTTKSGYMIAMISFDDDGQPTGYAPYISGFLKDGSAWGRPVDTAFGPDGALYVSDDYAGAVYRIAYDGSTATGKAPSAAQPAVSSQTPTEKHPPGTAVVSTAEKAGLPDGHAEAGKDLYRGKGCAGCHGTGPGATAAVPLQNLSRYAPEEIAAILTSPPGNMPSYRFEPQQLADLATYLRQTYP